MQNQSARWVENPYYQLFCGEEFFQHKLTFDRSSLTRWRQRMGDQRLVALIQESLSVATRTGAAKTADFSKVIVDTTVQLKAVAFPTDAKLMHRARERLVRLAKKTGVELRQSYERVGKHALIAHQRYAHAKQFKRANRVLKTIRTYLGRVTRDIVRKIGGDAELESVFAHPLMLGRPGARAAPASARTEDLLAACAALKTAATQQGRSTGAVAGIEQPHFLLATVPLGILVVGASVGVARALQQGLRARILLLIEGKTEVPVDRPERWELGMRLEMLRNVHPDRNPTRARVSQDEVNS